MADGKRSETQELGLELGLLALRFFTGAQELHYGLWDEGLEVDIRNLARAQQRYTEYLLSWVPADVGAVLDVGCGAGVTAAHLSERGYRVECVSPSTALARYARERVGEQVPIHRCRFQDLDVEPRFDLVLFSESFQYIPMDEALERAAGFLRPGGNVLICDFFRTDAPGRGPLGGGHRFSAFPEVLAASGMEVVAETDLTEFIAPTMDIYQQLSQALLRPGSELVAGYARRNHPWLAAMLGWALRRRFARFQRKYLSGERNAEAFRHWKTYRLLWLKAQEAGRVSEVPGHAEFDDASGEDAKRRGAL